MSIEIGSKWFKDGEVVVIREIGKMGNIDCIMYSDGVFHALTMCDFLEQYKPYEPVYEYQYAIKIGTGIGNILKIDNVIYYSDEYKHSISGAYYTDNEKKPEHWISYQRLDFTKRERKQ